MSRDSAIHPSDVVGMGRLAFDAIFGLTDVVEAMHGPIARRPFPIGSLTDTRTRGITRFVYQSIRRVTRLVADGFDATLALSIPAGGEPTSSPRRETLLAVLNGVVGDHLVASGNPLAIPLRFRAGGEALEPSRDVLASRLSAASGRILVLVHGLCMNDLQWRRRGHDHGEALARECGYTPLYVHYNSGRHVSLNGHDLANALEAMLASWPVPPEELVLLGHSMGGLVIRSACHQARLAGHRWLELATVATARTHARRCHCPRAWAATPSRARVDARRAMPSTSFLAMASCRSRAPLAVTSTRASRSHSRIHSSASATDATTWTCWTRRPYASSSLHGSVDDQACVMGSGSNGELVRSRAVARRSSGGLEGAFTMAPQHSGC